MRSSCGCVPAKQEGDELDHWLEAAVELCADLQVPKSWGFWGLFGVDGSLSLECMPGGFSYFGAWLDLGLLDWLLCQTRFLCFSPSGVQPPWKPWGSRARRCVGQLGPASQRSRKKKDNKF